jgi:hypothetical protein
MTHDDLAILIREDVRATEPHHGLDPMVPVRLGRRRLRSRHVRLAGAAAAVVAAAVIAPLAIVGGGGPPDPAPTAPTAAPWLARVRAALEPSTGALSAVSVRREGTQVEAGLGGDPTGWHFYTVTADSADKLDDPAAYCQERLSLGYISCTVDHDAAGRTTVVQELLVVNVGARPTAGFGHTWDLSFARIPVDNLGSVNPADRFFRREAIAVTAFGTLKVSEQLQAPTPAAAAAAYVVPPAALIAVASDPELAEAH